MNFEELDTFVAGVLNVIKEVSESQRESILSGNLDHESYKHESGVLLGMETSCGIIMEEARKYIKETLDNE